MDGSSWNQLGSDIDVSRRRLERRFLSSDGSTAEIGARYNYRAGHVRVFSIADDTAPTVIRQQFHR